MMYLWNQWILVRTGHGMQKRGRNVEGISEDSVASLCLYVMGFHQQYKKGITSDK